MSSMTVVPLLFVTSFVVLRDKIHRLKIYINRNEPKRKRCLTFNSAISCSRFAKVTMNAASFFFAFSS